MLDIIVCKNGDWFLRILKGLKKIFSSVLFYLKRVPLKRSQCADSSSLAQHQTPSTQPVDNI